MYSNKLSISFEICVNYLNILQKKALNNIKEHSDNQKNGIAIVKCKILCEQPKTVNMSVNSNFTGYMLKENISKEVCVSIERYGLFRECGVLI